MRIKPIQQLQQGGAMAPFVDFTPMPIGVDPGAMAKEQEVAQKANIDWDKLKPKGLQNDVAAFTASTTQLLSTPISRDNYSTMARKQMLISSELNRLEQNLNLFNSAVSNAEKSDAINEIAFTGGGGVAVYDQDGRFKVISNRDYNPEKYSYATVGDVIKERATNPAFANNNDLINVINRGVGRSVVNKKVQDIVAKLKADSVQNSQILTKEQMDIANTLNNPEGIYKVSEKQEAVSDQKKELAARYILAHLTPREREIFNQTAKDMGTDAWNTLQSVIHFETATKVEKDIQHAKDPNASGAGSGSKGSKKDLSVKPIMAYQMGENGQKGTYVLNPGKGYAIKSSATMWNAPLGADGKQLKPGAFGTEFMEKGMGAILDGTSVYVGNQKVDALDFNKVYFDGQQIARTFLPVERGANGEIKPNFALLEKYEKAKDKIDALGDKATNLQISQIAEDFGVMQYMKTDPQTGKLSWDIENKFRPFMLTNVIAGDEVLQDADVNDYMTETKRINRDKYKEWNKQIAESVNDLESDKFFRAVAFIPITTVTSQAMNVAGEDPTLDASYGNMERLKEQELRDQRRLTFNSASSEVL